MKKIIATVLAMVMALALCATAFAAADKFDVYSAKNIKNNAIPSGTDPYSTLEDVEIKTVAAVKNSDGTGNLEYIQIGSWYYVKTTTPTNSDFAVTAANKADVLYYLTEISKPTYDASAKAFTAFGYKCGEIVNTDNSEYYEVTTGSLAGNVYKATTTGATMNLLVDGKIVTVSTTATDLKDHKWAVSASKVVNGKIVPTEVTCGLCGKKITAIYKKGQAPAGSTVKEVPGFGDYEFVTIAGNTSNGSSNANSPKTFDAGVAMYAGMALMSVAGSAVVIGKKKEF